MPFQRTHNCSLCRKPEVVVSLWMNSLQTQDFVDEVLEGRGWLIPQELAERIGAMGLALHFELKPDPRALGMKPQWWALLCPACVPQAGPELDVLQSGQDTSFARLKELILSWEFAP